MLGELNNLSFKSMNRTFMTGRQDTWVFEWEVVCVFSNKKYVFIAFKGMVYV